MKKTILLTGTFDTKGPEFGFIRDLIRERGLNTLLMDTGVLGEPFIQPDITAGEIAEAGGSTLRELREKGDRGYAVDVMIRGVKNKVRELYETDEFDAMLSLGGGAGTNIGTAGMRELPVGVPKVMVSTLASGDVSSFVDVKDITMMYSVVDIAGLNRLSRRILANAAGAICGMVETELPKRDEKPLIAATMFGVTTPCVTRFRELMDQAGYETVVFHATGSGGRAMEGLIRDGYFTAVADLTTTEWCDEVAGGVLSAGPNRMEAAAETGIPQVVSCGALDMVNFNAMDTVPERYKKRNLYKHNPTVTLMRTTVEECKEIAIRMAEKLNRAKGPVVLLLPLNGVSMMDRDGQPFYDPEADQALFETLRGSIAANVRLIELDLNINDPEFAKAAADELLGIMGPEK
ncbi:MAG: Tm-1-like ATP-binding domain-containing protein [Balneolaceae bacterium]|nr:Tm-1-like ATP-binding domain-containing protein [Balneolaceae bacterium]